MSKIKSDASFDLSDSSTMQKVWNSYISDTPCAKDDAFEETLKSIESLMLLASF